MTSPSPFSVIVLAAGQGTRMRSDTHKVLHPIAGKAMLMHLLDTVDGLGAKERVVVVGKGRDQVEVALNGRGVKVAHCAEQKGTAHAVQQAETVLSGFEGNILILYGDTPFVAAGTLTEMLERLDGPDAPAIVVLVSSPDDPKAYGPGDPLGMAIPSPRWSSTRMPPRRSGRSACATAA